VIYVATGTHPVSFDRLIRVMDDFAGTTTEKVIIQAGTSQLPIQHAEHLTFVTWEDSLNYIKTARLVVCHGGVGTLMDAIAANTPVIIWPRLAQFGEAANDHQLEIASVLSEQKRAIMVNNAEELLASLRSETVPQPNAANGKGGGLIVAIRDSLNTTRQDRGYRRNP
jgi:UDP-N-acetylglucosamine transferase subunit ALG13